MNKINPRSYILAAFILAVGIFRIITATTHSPLSGFTPLGAMALFSGFYFQDKVKAFALPILTLWISDIILNRFLFFGYWVFFYNSFVWVYGSFALMVLLGMIFKKVTLQNIVLSSFAGAVIHWLVSNFGVWLVGCTGKAEDILYSANIEGLIKCYTMAFPYMINLLIGNLLFGAVLFGGFQLLQRRFPVLQVN